MVTVQSNCVLVPHPDLILIVVSDRDALFLLCSQLLADSIKQSTLRGITVADNIITISQLADNTTLFLKDAGEIPKAINIIRIFSKASGLHLNINKCELMSLKQCNLPSICGIPIKMKSHI